jgi:hypothetical protein
MRFDKLFFVVTVLMALTGCSAERSGLAGVLYAADGSTLPDGQACPSEGCVEVDGGTPDVDAGLGVDAGPLVDTGMLGEDAGMIVMDAGTGAGLPDAGPVTVTFPLRPPDTASATISGGHYYYYTYGDYVRGSRTTSLPQTSGATVSLGIVYNGLGDACDFRMLINGIQVGTFRVSPGASTVSASFSFATITGPTYTLEYEVTRTVRLGSGSIQLNMDGGSTVTLTP